MNRTIWSALGVHGLPPPMGVSVGRTGIGVNVYVGVLLGTGVIVGIGVLVGNTSAIVGRIDVSVGNDTRMDDIGVSVSIEVDVGNAGVPVSADAGVPVGGLIMVNVGVTVEVGGVRPLKRKLPNRYNTIEINIPVPIPPHKNQFRLGAVGTRDA